MTTENPYPWADGMDCAVTVCDTGGTILYMNSKIKPNKSCKKFHARKLSFFVVAFSKMILAMGCKAAKRLYSLASHSQNR